MQQNGEQNIEMQYTLGGMETVIVCFTESGIAFDVWITLPLEETGFILWWVGQLDIILE